MTTQNLGRRVDRLKPLRPAPVMQWLLINGETETAAEAKARWCAQHPGKTETDVGVIVLTSLQPSTRGNGTEASQ